LDKVCRRLHLSKSKNSKFNESGQLVVFNAISLIWALDIIIKGNWLADIPSLWTGYPNTALSFSEKFFYIIQFAYWAHILPELYFQKIKKEEMYSRMKYAILYFAFVLSLYIINFHHIGVIVLSLHYMSGFTKHVVTLIDITEKEEDSKIVQLAQNVYNCLFIGEQTLILILSQVMLCLGLKEVEYTGELRDFNTPTLKLLISIISLATQAWAIFEFFKGQRSGSLNITTFNFLKAKAKAPRVNIANKKRKIAANRKFNELTEADQNIRKTIKSDAKKAAKIAKSVK